MLLRATLLLLVLNTAGTFLTYNLLILPDEAALHDINEEQAAAAQHLEAEVPTFGTANAPEPPVTDVRDDDQEDVQDQLVSCLFFLLLLYF